jgi:hypothetical protein
MMIAQVMVRDFQLDFGSVVAWATREAERAPPAGGGATEHLAGQQVLLIPGPLHPTHARLAALSAGQIRQEAGGGGREGAAPSVRAERGVGPSPPRPQQPGAGAGGGISADGRARLLAAIACVRQTRVRLESECTVSHAAGATEEEETTTQHPPPGASSAMAAFAPPHPLPGM